MLFLFLGSGYDVASSINNRYTKLNLINDMNHIPVFINSNFSAMNWCHCTVSLHLIVIFAYKIREIIT